MKCTFLFAFLISSLLVFGSASADPCKPVIQFIDLGKKAEKCVSRIEANDEKANDVLAHYGFCTNVREARHNVENSINTLPATTLNSCAEKNLQAYSDAANAIQRLYQIELQLR
jgi:hypothetical protein